MLTERVARRRAALAAKAVPGMALAAALADRTPGSARAMSQTLEVRALAGTKGAAPMSPKDKPYVGPKHRLRYLEEKL